MGKYGKNQYLGLIFSLTLGLSFVIAFSVWSPMTTMENPSITTPSASALEEIGPLHVINIEYLESLPSTIYNPATHELHDIYIDAAGGDFGIYLQSITFNLVINRAYITNVKRYTPAPGNPVLVNSSSWFAGIRITDCTGEITIQNSQIWNGHFGMVIKNTHSVQLINNTIQDIEAYGLNIIGSNNLQMSNSRILNTVARAVELNNSNSATIKRYISPKSKEGGIIPK